LLAHSDGDGASFVPDRPFRAGERVTVTAGAPLVGGAGGSVTFSIARTPGRERIHYTPDPGGDPRGAQHFRSRPGLSPPTLQVTTLANGVAPGSIFTAVKAGPGQDGPMITDGNGRLVWFRRVPHGTSAFDFRAQQYDGRPVLTWWQGRVFNGEGHGVGLIFDSSYRQIATVRMGNGYQADFHEFELGPNGTAFLLAFVPTRWNLARAHGSRRGVALDAVVQEIDVRTGLVMFEWHSLGNVGVNESYDRAGRGAFDYFHANSIDLEPDGNLLVSARNTHAVYEVDRRSGAVLWRLGGKRSSFAMTGGTRFVAQHHALRAPDGSITIFDNGSPPATGRPARGIDLKVDEAARTAQLAHSYTHARPRLVSASQGSMQTLPNGNAFIGWGGESPYMSEYAAAGQLVFDGHFVPSGIDTYRAYRFPWSARPAAPPDVAARVAGAATSVWASWNGATDVASWQVLAGGDPASLQPVAEGPLAGFETALTVPLAEPYVAVRAIDSSGQVLGTSGPVKPAG